MNILRLRISQIAANKRLRPVDEDYARLLATSMAQIGQMTPIEVIALPDSAEQGYALISGAHRLAAAKIAGFEEIDATLFEGSDLEATLREIDENLIRHELKELDRSTFLARRKEVYEQLFPETRHGAARKDEAGQFGNSPVRFTIEAADKLGISSRSVSRAIQRYNRIAPDVRAAIATLWVADSGTALDALAKLPGNAQRQVAQVLRDRPGMRSVAEALDIVDGRVRPAPDPDEQAFEAFLKLWRRMAPATRRRVVDHVRSWAGGTP